MGKIIRYGIEREAQGSKSEMWSTRGRHICEGIFKWNIMSLIFVDVVNAWTCWWSNFLTRLVIFTLCHHDDRGSLMWNLGSCNEKLRWWWSMTKYYVNHFWNGKRIWLEYSFEAVVYNLQREDSQRLLNVLTFPIEVDSLCSKRRNYIK